MKNQIKRPEHVSAIKNLLRQRRIVLILGARQVGKTTIANDVLYERKGHTTFLDLEDPRDLAKLKEPMMFLEPLRGLVVIDEVQNKPGLFPVLRVLADRPRTPARFLLLGSASPDLLRQGSETLAGRIAFYTMTGFDIEEIDPKNLGKLWLRGGFPLSFLATSHKESADWRRDFIRTFLERDLPQLGITIPSATLRRFWTMLAHYHGQVWNGAEFGRSFGVSHTSVRKYLDLLSNTFVIRQLQPWKENLKKRQIKSPKVYVSDSGILHTLLDLDTMQQLEGHPKLGASWEGFALEAVVRRTRARDDQCFFWATHGGAELDLLIVKGNKRWGFEFKRTEAPQVTPSMKIALDDLKLVQLDVVHAGQETFPLGKRIKALAAIDPLNELKPL
jgi:predicted AAA+ superfamily ATPase